jgi:hypothetical protein
MSQVLAKLSEVEIPGGFAKFIGTLTIQSFSRFLKWQRAVRQGVFKAAFDTSKEVCQNSLQNPFLTSISRPGVAKTESRFTGLKHNKRLAYYRGSTSQKLNPGLRD